MGTAAVTSRGLNENDMDKIAEFITMVTENFESNAQKVRDGVKEICDRYPIY